jgi:transcriptional regulator with XRE-family HTH domain
MEPVSLIRSVAGWTQRRLAQAAGTSQPTIAAYEGGSKSPTWRTVSAIAGAAGLACYPSVGLVLTRDQARSLELHRAIVTELMAHPDTVIARAQRNLETMRRSSPMASRLLDEWESILRQTPRRIAAQLLDPGEHGRDLRQVTPFAGVLDPHRRMAVYRKFGAVA